MQSNAVFNPFPGLRPFEPDEDHLFFGREKEIDELLRRLRSTRFLHVVGSSGSGKSSLVRCGLIPSLYGGFMVKAGSSWRVLILRPGGDPIGHLAASLSAPGVLGAEAELASTNRVLVEATLRRGTLGLVEAVHLARIPRQDNLLVVVDQFEELFRFRRSGQTENSRDEAVAFSKLLLEAVNQNDLPIYVVLTMRSDFVDDCMEFPGLPESINTGLYLVPRMTRDELRSAITGPAAVGGGEITPRLVLRLLNDLGDDPNQLPVLQHALMRTWDHWEAHRQPGQIIDITDYEAIGTLQHALSMHAEEAYQEAVSDRNQQIPERMFKALTDTFSDPRGVRRPTSIQELSAICQVAESEIIRVVEVFRRRGRSFLTPPADTPLDSRSVIDLSHESLMRCWTRLITWAKEERESATSYKRISQAANWCQECEGGLWVDPQLEIGLQWKRKNQPNAAWAGRYDPNFALAMDFLDRSEKQREAERQNERRRKLTRQIVSYVLATLLAIVLALLYQLHKQKNRAEYNLVLARDAVDQSLSSAGSEQAREAADSPQMEEFRKELLDKAKTFYLTFAKEEPRSEELLKDSALARVRLADINRLLEMHEDAVTEYKEAISQLTSLVQRHPKKLEYSQRLAYCHNWLGETLRLWLEQAEGTPRHTSSDAENEYNAALRLQQDLSNQAPKNPAYRQELARTYYNRGILKYDEKQFDRAESDFQQAAALLEPLVEEPIHSASKRRDSPSTEQDLGRIYNNMGLLLQHESRLPEAQSHFEHAISIHEQLIEQAPDNRELKFELAKFSKNLAGLLVQQKQLDAASRVNDKAVDTLDELAVPAHSLGVEQAKAHTLDSLILESTDPQEAQREADRALEILEQMKKKGSFKDHPEDHVLYLQIAYNYLEIAKKGLETDSLADARIALSKIPSLLPNVTVQDRPRISDLYKQMQAELRNKIGATK